MPKEKHSHPPNFGRYVEGCAQCAAKWPDGPPPKPARKPRAPKAPSPVQETAPSSTDSLVELMLEERRELMEKRQIEKLRAAEHRQQMIAAARVQEAQKREREEACGRTGHMKENGRSAVAGQVHNDGLVHQFCQRCHKLFPPRPPHQEQMSNAVAG